MKTNTVSNQWQVFMPYIGSCPEDNQLAEIQLGPNTSIGFVVLRGRPLFTISYLQNNVHSMKYANSIIELDKGIGLNLVDQDTLQTNTSVAEVALGKDDIIRVKAAIHKKIEQIAV